MVFAGFDISRPPRATTTRVIVLVICFFVEPLTATAITHRHKGRTSINTAAVRTIFVCAFSGHDCGPIDFCYFLQRRRRTDGRMYFLICMLKWIYLPPMILWLQMVLFIDNDFMIDNDFKTWQWIYDYQWFFNYLFKQIVSIYIYVYIYIRYLNIYIYIVVGHTS